MPPELRPGQNFEFDAPGFNGIPWRVGVAAMHLTLDTVGQEQQVRPGPLDADQYAIMRFIAENVGRTFRPADVYPYFDTQHGARDRFNAATYHQETGLYAFVTHTTGENNLWQYDGKDNQFGNNPVAESEAPESVPSGGAEGSTAAHDFDHLSKGETELLVAAIDLATTEPMPSREFFKALADRVGGTPAVVERAFSLMIRKQATLTGIQPFTLRWRGKGRHRTADVHADPAIFTSPDAVMTPLETEPLFIHEKHGTKENPPRVTWKLSVEDGLVIDGHRLLLDPSAEMLLHALNHHGKRANLSVLANMYLSERLDSDEYERFVGWASRVFDVTNLYAPVVIIDNGQPGTRSRHTSYSINRVGSWENMRRFQQGSRPYNPLLASVHNEVVLSQAQATLRRRANAPLEFGIRLPS